MNSRTVIYLVLILLLYFGIHLFLYFSLSRFFNFFNHSTRNLLAIILGVLSVSFFISALLVRFSDFIIFRIYYFISAFWMGFLVYLLMAIVLAWIIILGLKLFGFNCRLIISSGLIIVVFIYSIYAVINAMHPTIKELEIEIKDLPQAWKGKTIVQLSDVHLGKIHGVSFAQKLVEQVNDLNPDLVVITGDLFDGMGSNHNLFLGRLDKLNAKQGIYFVTGNHEVYLGSLNIIKAIKQSKINVLDDEFVNIDGLQIVGISFPEFDNTRDRKNIIMELEGYDINKPSILLYHEPASIEQRRVDNSSRRWQTYYSPNTDFTPQKEAGIDLQLSGHTHKGQLFPFNLIAEKIYHGYDYGLYREGDFNIYITNGVGTWGPPMRTGNKPEIVLIKVK